jgi:thymidylate synthase (FAD)
MKIIKPSYEIRTSLSENGLYILKDLEEDSRTCYRSEVQATNDGESAKKLVRHLIRSGHEAAIEGYDIKVRFVCDRGVSHELVRHRMASFTQESTRWCNYADGKFGSEITVIEPVEFEGLDEDKKQEACDLRSLAMYGSSTDANEADYSLMEMGSDYIAYAYWEYSCNEAENSYMQLLRLNFTPQMARSVLPNSLKTVINVKANVREWRHILKLRTAPDAHPEMRRLMVPLLREFQQKIPVLFDDILPEVEDNG